MQPGILSKKIVDLESWRLLADRTRKEPLFREPCVKKYRAGRIRIRAKEDDPAMIAIRCLVFIGVIGLIWLGISLLEKEKEGFWKFAYCVLIILVFGWAFFSALRGILWSKTLFLLPEHRVLFFAWGFRLWPSKIRLPIDGLQARLMLSHETPGFSPKRDPLGRLWLVLSHRDSLGDVLRIAQGEDHAEMTRVFLAIRGFLSGASSPDVPDPLECTSHQVSFGDGRVFRISRVPIAGGGTARSLHRLRFSTPDKCKFAEQFVFRTLSRWPFVILAAAIMGVLTSVINPFVGDLWAYTIQWCFLIFLSGFFIRMRNLPQDTVADRTAGHVTVRTRDKNAVCYENSIISLDQIVAVQICAKTYPGKRKPFYEINLVLAGEQDHRVNITSHGREKQLREDAARFAEFLGRPLLDHAGVSSYATAYQEPQRVLRRAHTQD